MKSRIVLACLLPWITATLIGCATPAARREAEESLPTKRAGEEEGQWTKKLRPKPDKGMSTGLDPRARDIERHLGVE